jgi:hypothetical protein
MLAGYCCACHLIFYLMRPYEMEEGIGKSMKSKGGIEGSIPRPVGGWVCYTMRPDSQLIWICKSVEYLN